MSVAAELVVSGVSIAGGLTGLALAYVGWKRQDHPAALPFSKMAVLTGLWGVLYGFTVFARDVGTAYVMFRVTGVFGVLATYYFVVFALVYTGSGGWLTNRRRRLLFGYFGVIAVVTLLDSVAPVTTTNGTMLTQNGLTLIVVDRKPLHWVFVALAYPGVVVGLWLLGRFLVSPRNIYRKQTGTIMLGIVATFSGSVFFQARLTPHPGLDLTPVFYAVNATFIALALFHYEFLDVEPLAPDVVLREIDDPVFVLDDEERIVDTNQAARSLFDDDTALRGPIEETLPGLLEAAREETEYVPETARDETDGGTVEVYDLNRAPIRDQYDRDRGSVVVLRDITVQKRREETLDSLQAVSQRFLGAETKREVGSIAVETAAEVLGYPYSGLVVHDETTADGEVLSAVAIADPLLDVLSTVPVPDDTRTVQVESLDGTRTVDVPVVEPGNNTVWEVFESGEPVVGEPIEFEGGTVPEELGNSLLLPLGEHGVFGITAEPGQGTFSADDRRFAHALASTTENALDSVEKERQLRESRELLAQRTEQIEFFNSVLRHDLLNGMMVIQGHVDLLEDHVDEEGQPYLETVDEWGKDITTLAKKVRSVTKTVSGERDVELGPVDLHDALTRKADKIASSHEGVRVDVRAENVAVRGDDLLPEVVENVLLNAVEHNDADTPAIGIETRRDGDRVQVRIADNGPGVPDEMKERVFEEQVTSEDSGSIGFGLYFVSVMMDLYGGDVWFEDRTDADPVPGDGGEAVRGAVAVLEFPTLQRGQVREPASPVD